ncbi:uncharacterized acetyltransferase At3g50280-like [Phalaenopsis equestris]|uniref:uncharacterized acetyltransferase At3g50280-like n=1 Tax=Phalaenopsis equestris TaxID=78828 RepID=UPI0009E1EE7C|nr:uncharacterized acetyltransferase At3g50280-like [Phalaenopsis equestris]
MSESEAEQVRILSRHTIRPSPPPPAAAVAAKSRIRQIHLNQWDLHLLSNNYIQKGLLFPPPIPDQNLLIPLLLSSFSQALNLFYPFAGRLSTTRHPTYSISIHANDAGAEFIHSSAPHLTSSDFTSSLFIPPAVRSLFPLDNLVNHDGHTFPLLAAQANILADGSLFLACSLNHAVADGASFWHFINTWSALTRSGGASIGDAGPPVIQHWFHPSTPPPIGLPFRNEAEFIVRDPLPATRECFFHFSGGAVARLKDKANREMGVTRISSLQALLAHMWRATTRARGLKPDIETTYVVIVGHRHRVTPPLPKTYMGNTAIGVPATARAGELAENGLGWAALQLNKVVAFATEENAIRWLENWAKRPQMMKIKKLHGTCLLTGSSPRFDVFGNDFGWGRPAEVRSGSGSKLDGKVTVYEGKEGGGSMALEVCLSAAALNALVVDEEFMEAVGLATG